jgi:hypothetical protein
LAVQKLGAGVENTTDRIKELTKDVKELKK